MAMRELRRSPRKFVFFLLCIAIGVSGLVAIKGFNASLQGALLREARTLMAADMQVSMNQPAAPDQLELFDQFRQQGIEIAHITETASMAVNPVNRETSVVEIKATSPGYPFYGVLEVSPPVTLTPESALVAGELLDRLGLSIGDAIRLGTADFTVSGIIVKEPDRVAAGFGLGPRVMLTQEGLNRAGIIQVGSRARQIYLLRLTNDEQVEGVRDQLQAIFARDRARIADFREAQPQVKRFLDRMTSFLSLVSMVALLVGGLGVANATRVFIQQKLDSIAIMKSLGATNRRVYSIYLTQMLLLGAAGSALGVVIGYLIQLVLPRVIGNFLDLTLDLTLSPMVAVQGMVVGLLTSTLFTLIPLTGISDVKPALVFRREMSEYRRPNTWLHRWRTAGLFAIVGIGLILIAGWISDRFIWGLYFMAGLIGAVLVLGAASYGAVRLVRRIKVPRNLFTLRQGLANLYRPGSQASAIVLSLGIGVTMVLGVLLLQRGLSQEVSIASPDGVPNMFFIGIQGREQAEFRQFVAERAGVEESPEMTPIVRGRLVTLDGKGKSELNLAQDDERWFDFQFSLTFSEELSSGSELSSGTWWNAADIAANRSYVSVEKESADRLKLRVGSKIVMDLEGGDRLETEVKNIRRTTDFRAGGSFNFVFIPGILDDMPITYLAQARVKPDAASQVRKDVVERFPAITIINLDDVLQSVGDILRQIGLVIQFVAGFSVVAGLIILASSVASTKFRRTREAVLYRTLGATGSKVWRIFAAEYLVLGLVASLVGAVLSAVSAWAVLTYVMEITYRFEFLPLLIGIIVTTLLTVIVGVLSTLDVLRAKPLQVLRED